MVPNDVIQSKRMWDSDADRGEEPQPRAGASAARTSFATGAIASARNGRTTNECVQLRWSFR